jgi:energy-coupling factor transporter ATP-binding protein EcfA2
MTTQEQDSRNSLFQATSEFKAIDILKESSVKGLLIAEENLSRLVHFFGPKFKAEKPVYIELEPRLNVFFGKNGAGKTSLLRMIHAANSLLGSAYEGLVFDHPVMLDFYVKTEMNLSGFLRRGSFSDAGNANRAKSGDPMGRLDPLNFVPPGITNFVKPTSETDVIAKEFLVHGKSLVTRDSTDRLNVLGNQPATDPFRAEEIIILMMLKPSQDKTPNIFAELTKMREDFKAVTNADKKDAQYNPNRSQLEAYPALMDFRKKWNNSPLLNPYNLSHNLDSHQNVFGPNPPEHVMFLPINVADIYKYGPDAEAKHNWICVPTIHEGFEVRTAHAQELPPNEALRRWFAEGLSHSGGSLEKIDEIIDNLATGAEQMVRKLIDPLLPSLKKITIERGNVSTWLRGDEPYWFIPDGRSSGRIQMKDLSAAETRWVRAAVNIVTSDPKVILIDESERGLHRTLEAASAEVLALTWSKKGLVCITSHSPEFIYRNDCKVHLIEDGSVEPFPADALYACEALGIRETDLLARTKLFLLLEGQHDVTVFNTLFGDRLLAHGVRILSLGGAKQATNLFSPDSLIRYSEASFMIVLDNTKSEEVIDAWTQIKSSIRVLPRSQTKGAEEKFKKLINEILPLNDSGERKYMREYMSAAYAAEKYDRVYVDGVEKKDIQMYLPEEDFLKSGAQWADGKRTWDDHYSMYEEWLKVTTATLTNEWREAMKSKPPKMKCNFGYWLKSIKKSSETSYNFKDWLKSINGSEVNRFNISKSVNRLKKSDEFNNGISELNALVDRALEIADSV